MDRLRAMEVFVHVVDRNGFQKAAHALSLPRSSVTMTIQRLEQHLGVQLINRTTRQIKLTPDGEAYYEQSRQILSMVDTVENGLRDGRGRASGRLRVNMPASIGRSIILPALPGFRERYPEVDLVIGMSDRLVDLVQEGIDCVIRTGTLPDSSLIARRIGCFRWVVCAAPSYLAARGEPQELADLQDHIAIGYSSSRNGRPDGWTFSEGGASTTMTMRTGLVVDETFALRDLATAGFGLARLSDFIVADAVKRGGLREVLGSYSPEPVPVSVLYPSSRHLSPALRVFVDWVQSIAGARLAPPSVV